MTIEETGMITRNEKKNVMHKLWIENLSSLKSVDKNICLWMFKLLKLSFVLSTWKIPKLFPHWMEQKNLGHKIPLINVVQRKKYHAFFLQLHKLEIFPSSHAKVEKRAMKGRNSFSEWMVIKVFFKSLPI